MHSNRQISLFSVKILTLLQLSYMNTDDKKQRLLLASGIVSSKYLYLLPRSMQVMFASALQRILPYLCCTNVIICVAFVLLQSRIFTTDLLIIGRQLVEHCVFLVACHCMIHCICLQFDMKIWQIN